MKKKGNKFLALLLLCVLLLGSVSSVAMSVVAEGNQVDDQLEEFEDFSNANLSSEVLGDFTAELADFLSPDDSPLVDDTLESDLSGFEDTAELEKTLEELQDIDLSDFVDGDSLDEFVNQSTEENTVENPELDGFTDFDGEFTDESVDSQEDFADLDALLDDFSDVEGFEDINFEDFGETLDLNGPGSGREFVQGKPKIVQAKWARKALTAEGESSAASERLIFYFELYDSASKSLYFTTKLSKDLSFEENLAVEGLADNSLAAEGLELGEGGKPQVTSGIEVYKEYITDKFVDKQFSKAAKPSQEAFDKMFVGNMVILHDQNGNKFYRAERLKKDANESADPDLAKASEKFDSQFLIHQCMNTQVSYLLAEGTELSPEEEANLGLIFTVKELDSFGNEQNVFLNEKMIFGDGNFQAGESEWLVDTAGNFKLAMRKGVLDLFTDDLLSTNNYQLKVKFSNKNLAQKYNLEVEGDAISGWTVVLRSRVKEIPVQVEWDDKDNEKGLRPEKLDIPYTDENGESQILELNSVNNWSGIIRILASKQEDPLNSLNSFDLQNLSDINVLNQDADSLNSLNAVEMQSLSAMGAESSAEGDSSQENDTFIGSIDEDKLAEFIKAELEKVNIPEEYKLDIILKDGVIKLICQLNLHTVQYKLSPESKEILAEHMVKDGAQAVELKAPVLEGYDFVAWQLNGEDYDFTKPVSEDLLLVAAWKKQGCTITYEFNNGMPAHKEVVAKGAITKEPDEPVKDHYRFKGWLLNGSQFSFGGKLFNDITLIADWEIIKYKVVFNNGGGSEVGTQSVKSGGLVLEPKDPVRKGYTFAGWYNGEESYNFETPVSKDLILTAKWEKNSKDKYTVNFHLNGAKGKIASQQIEPGGRAKEPDNPNLEGKTFQGWFFKDKDGKLKKFDFSTTIDRNYLLVAGWKKAEHTLRRILGKGLPTQIEKVKDGGTMEEKKVPEREGFRFEGWYKDDGKEKFDTEEKIYKDTDIKAKWIPTHKVIFDSTGGSEVKPQVVDKGAKAKEPEPPAREGYQFLGWGLNVKGKLKKFNFEKVTIDRDFNLKAVWKKQAEGGGDSGDPKQMTKIPKTGLNSSPQLSQIGILITVAGLAYFVRRKLR